MRKTCFESVYRLAKKHKDVVFVGSDLGAGVLNNFRTEIPDRFFMEGVSEQHLVGMCAGLALEGFNVYVSTIATFMYRRPYEQIVLDAALHNLNVRFLAIGGGLVYAPLGPTHLAIDDLALMRAIPNMTVIVPADAVEMAALITESYSHPGPIYVRIAKGGDKVVTPAKRRYRIGQGYSVRTGTDVLLVTTGITEQIAMEAAVRLEGRGISAGILHLPTVKPLDTRMILSGARKVRAVMTLEEHSEIGGLGSAVADLLLSGSVYKRFSKIALPDSFPRGYGSQQEQLSRLGVDRAHVVRTALRLLR